MRRGARFGYCFPVAGLRVENERDRARVVAGLIAAPLVATLVAYVGFPIVHWSGEPLYGRSTYSSDAPLAFASGIAIVAIFAVIVFAAPALWWLLRRGPVTLEQTLVAGFVIGTLPYVLLALWISLSGKMGDTYGVPGVIRGLLIGSILGVLSAGGFWIVAATGRRST